MKKNLLSLFLLALLCSGWIFLTKADHKSDGPLGNEPIAEGKFKPSWESLGKYKVPEWYRNAKFGLWAHWGPQCEPEQGDWYARQMYIQGHRQYIAHSARYGHPSKSGFKDVIHQWRAEEWRPDELLALYQQAGAKYFMALANHHDN